MCDQHCTRMQEYLAQNPPRKLRWYQKHTAKYNALKWTLVIYFVIAALGPLFWMPSPSQTPWPSWIGYLIMLNSVVQIPFAYWLLHCLIDWDIKKRTGPVTMVPTPEMQTLEPVRGPMLVINQQRVSRE